MMENVTVRLVILLLPILMMLQSLPGFAFEDQRTLLVTGVQNESGSREWDEQLVAMGVANLISEELFKTGRYVPMETNPEVLQSINEMIALNRQRADVSLHPDRSLRFPQMETDAMAYGVIRRYEKRRKRAIAGLFSFAKVTAYLEIEIIIEEKDGPFRSAVGKAEGETVSKGLLVQIREEEIRFDQTSLGAVASDAVRQAVSQLFPE